jgi:hypothetical protein
MHSVSFMSLVNAHDLETPGMVLFFLHAQIAEEELRKKSMAAAEENAIEEAMKTGQIDESRIAEAIDAVAQIRHIKEKQDLGGRLSQGMHFHH